MRWSEFKQWSEYDQAVVLAWRKASSEVHRCGTVTSEWFGGDGRVLPPGEDPYVLEKTFCPGCSDLEEAREEASKSDSAMRGVSFHFRPRGAYDVDMDV